MIVSKRFDDLGKDDSTHAVRLGIMGGTFDPIHLGHLVMAEEARELFDLDAVLFMPAGVPARKRGRNVTPAEMRLRMTELAIESNPAFDVSRVEIDRGGVTYAVDTLKELRRHYPENVRLYFITGADAVLDIIGWKDAESIAGLATFIGATRPGYDLEDARRGHAASNVDFDVHYVEVPALAISSTDLRRRMAAGRSIRYLTPQPVVDFIEKNGLYRPEVLSENEKLQEDLKGTS